MNAAPRFPRDGNYLYFSSDREGGIGGYDIYVTRTDGQTWTAAERLNASINSRGNETGPAPSSDGEKLYFSSDRDAADDAQDIYVAKRVVAESRSDETSSADADESGSDPMVDPKQEPPLPAPTVVETAAELPPLPTFAMAEPASSLNSEADDIEAALSGRGDQVFLASDRDRDGQSGFNLYLSRVVNGRVQSPQKVDVYIKRGNATDPAVRMDGFDLLFSADGDLAAGEKETGTAVAATEPNYRLYRSTTREVIGYTDLSQWELFKALMSKILWWILLAIAALIGLIYLLERWNDITDLFHKCLAGSVAAHLLLLFLMMSWFISQAIEEGGEQQSPEVALSLDALAQEELAMESEQELAQVADTTQMIVSKNVQDFREVAFNPQQVVDQPLPIVQKTSDQSLLSDFQPSKASESTVSEPIPQPLFDAPALSELSPVELPDLAVEELELADLPTDKPIEPVDPTKDDFRRDEQAIQQVETQQVVVERTKSQQLDVQTEAEAVAGGGATAKTIDTQGDIINPSDGLEADGLPPALEGSDALASFAAKLPGGDAVDIPGGEKFETPDHELDAQTISSHVKKRRGKLSDEVVEQLGGSQGTEKAIGLGLDWFTEHQEPDGRWEMAKHGSKSEHNTAGAGLALLCYYGWGIKHGSYADNPKYDAHAQAVTKAVDWLVKQQKEDGDLRGGTGNHGMYCHGIAAIALCEGFGLTKDPKLEEPATKAIEFILNAQHEAGGWRYQPRQAGDLSATGWQYMALHSARMAGIDVPDEAFTKTDKFLTAVSGGEHGGLYGYTGPDKNKPTMTATGMFLRQLDLAAPTELRMQESAGVLKSKMLKANRVDFYFDYYATLALYQHQGPIWQEWNENLKEVYVTLQKTTGSDKGSWDVKGNHVNAGGRVLSTGLAILSLEVYYRLLPMYGYERD